MAAISNIVLGDSSATPVNYTWEPDKIDGPIATLLEQTRYAGIATGFSPMTISVNRASNGSKVNKVRVKIAIPHLDAENNVDGVVTGDLTFLLPINSIKAQRSDIRTFMRNVLDDETVIAAIDDLRSIY